MIYIENGLTIHKERMAIVPVDHKGLEASTPYVLSISVDLHKATDPRFSQHFSSPVGHGKCKNLET